MPAYNFKARFTGPIQAGEKTTTIRPRRKHPTKAGDTLHLYTGLRTKSAALIGRYRCIGVKPVIIDTQSKVLFVDGLACTNGVVSTIARSDGFASLDAFFQFFHDTYGGGRLENMELIAWDPVQLVVFDKAVITHEKVNAGEFAFSGDLVYIVGEYIDTAPSGVVWDFVGVFTSVKKATAACKGRRDRFYAPLELNAVAPDEKTILPGAVYPFA